MNKQHAHGTDGHDEAITALDRLCARFELVAVTRPVAVAAADIIDRLQRRGDPLDDLHDVYIAATAATEQVPVLTGTVDHFERIDGVDVVDWAAY